jgi:hypothetical protein
MYVGHFGLALAVKGRRTNLPLAVCLVAATAPDFVMVLVDLARLNVYSHSLVAVGVLALAGAALTWIYLSSARDACWVGVLVLSHLPADWVTSRLALWPDGPVWGAGLYAHPGIDLILESALAVVGWMIYRHGLPESVAARPLAWAPLGVLLVLQGAWSVMTSGR